MQFTSVKVMREKNIIFIMSETFKSIKLLVVERWKVGLRIPVKISLGRWSIATRELYKIC